MNAKRIAIILLAASVLAGCKATTPGPTARLYLDMFEIERYAPHADQQASLMTTRFRLLERPESRPIPRPDARPSDGLQGPVDGNPGAQRLHR
jgi:hypothetical protein